MTAFPTTRWTLVMAAARPEEARRALQELLTLYWPPLVVFLQHRGIPLEEAQDVAQDLFSELLERDFATRLDPDRGRLRAFLKACARNHLARRRERDGARKRGGGQVAVPLDPALCERVEAPGSEDAERAYDRRWALQVMDRALQRLVAQSEHPELLRAFFGSGQPPPYREAADQAGMSLPRLKSFLHRARQRYRSLLLEEVGETVGDPAEVEAELAELLAALS